MSTRSFYFVNAVVSSTAVAFLFWLIYFHRGTNAWGDVSFLPGVNATLNTCAALLLISGRRAILARRKNLHRTLMLSAFTFSVLFLICYLIYHAAEGDTPFLGQGLIRPFYFFILISHIVLSVVVFPMILTTLFFALTGKISKHRKIAPFTWGIWLYVSVTGVIVFLMLHVFWSG